MNPQTPPPWLERLLLWLLTSQDRETISGDLLEEYREKQLPRFGRARANYWYARQLISFAFLRIWGGSLAKQLLASLCLFTIAAAIWLIAMEHVLKHSGYAERSAIDACILVQSLGTLAILLLKGRPIFRTFILAGAAALLLLGVSAVFKILRADHFEGFVLLIGLALILQGALTLRPLFPDLRPVHHSTSLN